MATARTDHDVLHPVYRVTGILRWLLLIDAIVVNARRAGDVAHPTWLLVACVVMALWTAAAGALQSQRSTRTGLVMGADLLVTLVLVSCSRWVLGREAVIASYLSVPVLWLAAAPLVIAVWKGGWWGLAAAAAVGMAKFVQEPRPDTRIWTSLVVTGLAAWGVGAIVDTLRESIAEREANQARAAALAERERLNRIVHDGALQVLAMVEREGPALGPRGRYLADLSREQEILLRKLLQDRDVDVAPEPDHETDVVAMLNGRAGSRVTVTATCGRLMLEPLEADELDAAVSEALTNVRRHAGEGAWAWILIEDEGSDVLVTVRDDGIGASPADFAAAELAGRFGVQQSIRGRIEGIGGTAEVTSRPGRGLEWEFRVPRGRRVQGFDA